MIFRYTTKTIYSLILSNLSQYTHMKNNKSVVCKILILTACLGFLVFPFQSTEAFWPFKKKPGSVPSAELTLILDAGRKSLLEELGGELREGGYCEAAIMELALDGLVELASKNLLDAARKTFINIEKTILGGATKIGGELGEIIIAMGRKTAKALFEEEMDKQKSKEKDEKVVLSRSTGTGCDYKINVDWFKKEKRVHVLMEGDCHCKEQSTGWTKLNSIPKPLSKFKTEFDIEYHYDEVEYEMEDGQTQKVLGVVGGLKKKEGPYKFPLENICQSWYEGRDEKEAECGCKDGKPVKEVSASPGIIKPDSQFAFLDTMMEKVGMFFAFGPQRKTERALGYAEEKLAEMGEMAIKNLPDAFLLAGGRYRDLMEQISAILAGTKDGSNYENLTELVNERVLLHQSFLIRIVAEVSGLPFESTAEKFVTDLKDVIRWKEGDIVTPKYADPEGDKKKPAPVVKPETDKKDFEEKKSVEEPTAKPPVSSPKPADKPVIQPVSGSPVNICGDKKVAGSEECDPPGIQAQCYEGGLCGSKCLCEYQIPEDVCGDGKITGLELCDGASFSAQCLQAVEDYKAIHNNPSFVPRCFNNCRGCEASVPGR